MCRVPTFVATVALLQWQVISAVSLSRLRSSQHRSVPQPLPWSTAGNDGKVQNITCDDKTMTLPLDAIVLKGAGKIAVWCPSAKIATTTFYTAIGRIVLGLDTSATGESNDRFGSMVRSYMRNNTVGRFVHYGRSQELCKLSASFAFLRNPWDRLRSAYLDKVNRIVFVPGNKHATFAEFLRAVQLQDPREMDAHWAPVSSHCNTSAGTLTKLYKIEDHFENSLADIFETLGYSKTTSRKIVKEIGKGNTKNASEHGLSARKTAYATAELKKIVADIYAEDIKLGGYAFDA